ncbi:MAG: beta-glucanosyltransferase [Sarcosagium campestre]|nr:MAG: beta-glucanosyltransferase [Sarcosagium campestre]
MKGIGILVSSTVALSASGVVATALQVSKRDTPPVSVSGNAFFAGDKRFYIRGVDYQPGGSSDIADPIADVDGCKRDIKQFTSLGINTIRVYTVDNTADHDECMNLLKDAGIYLVLDVNTPKYSLNRKEPDASYNDVYLQNIFATIDAFANYDNTLAFFSGNEVINDAKTTDCAPYVKAVTRDMRQYIGSMGYRKIPVGYSAADVSQNRKQMAAYMNCGTDDERSDFFAFNDYSWCDPSTFTKSGWDQKVKTFEDYSIPLFLSEFGCNTNERQFNEISALYSEKMSGVFSGGLVYEYSQEPSDYGLVRVSGSSVSPLKDFQALKKAYAAQDDPSGDGGYKKSGKASTCPQKSANWDVDTTSLPAIPEPAKAYMAKGAGKGAGLKGSGSQNAGTASSGTATAGSGQITATATGANKPGAAAGLRVPELSFTYFACGSVVLASSLLGSILL